MTRYRYTGSVRVIFWAFLLWNLFVIRALGDWPAFFAAVAVAVGASLLEERA